jgi:SagB-type dehydrogenase family enzyme
MRLKRAETIFLYWLEDQLVFENYRTRCQVAADPRTVWVLHFFKRWHTPEEFYGHMRGYERSSLRRSLQALTDHSLLVRENSPQARQDESFGKSWGPWLPHAGVFHFGTKDVKFGSSPRSLTAHLRRLLKDSPQPPFFKDYKKLKYVQLPEPRPQEGEFLRVLLRRRTHRRFSPKLLSRDQLAQLLFYTWGVTGFISEPILGRLPVKTSPSGGARHPGEVYVLALGVEGISPGLYHYAPHRHQLVRLPVAGLKSKAVRYCAGQKWFGNAAALFLMTAVFPRSMWKYRTPRAYRVVLTDAGHLCQVFCLLATWLGLAPFCTMALNDSLIEKDLKIDGVTESVLYVAGVGLPAEGNGTAPITFNRRLASL